LLVLLKTLSNFGIGFLIHAVGKEDGGFDSHREDDFFDAPGFGDVRGGDGGAFDKLAEARYADADGGDTWEPHGRNESIQDMEG
jgi:hypothetical protein